MRLQAVCLPTSVSVSNSIGCDPDSYFWHQSKIGLPHLTPGLSCTVATCISHYTMSSSASFYYIISLQVHAAGHDVITEPDGFPLYIYIYIYIYTYIYIYIYIYIKEERERERGKKKSRERERERETNRQTER